MKIDTQVPFFSNTPDKTHCFQAALRMVLKYFEPTANFSWVELEQITRKKPGLWTWPLAAMMWMKRRGYEVIDMKVFDYHKFIEDPVAYMIEFYGEEIAQEPISHSDLDQESSLTKQLLEYDLLRIETPSFGTIEKLLTDGYLLITLVDSRTLNNKSGYVGHFVVIKGMDNEGLIIHDPGLPPVENRRVSFEQFEKAWAVPDEKVKNMMAFKLTH